MAHHGHGHGRPTTTAHWGFKNPFVPHNPNFPQAAGEAPTRWDDLASAMHALETAEADVSGDTALRFFRPLHEGELADILDEAHGRGWTIEQTSAHAANATKGAAKWRIVSDEDLTRVQLLAGPDATWGVVESLIGSGGASVTGAGDDWTPPTTTDAVEQVGYLERAHDAAQNALDRAEQLEGAARDKLKKAAGVALQKTSDLAHDVVKNLPHTVAAQALAERASKVYEGAKDAAKSALPWYLAIGVGAWIAIGVGAFVILRETKKAEPAVRQAAMAAA